MQLKIAICDDDASQRDYLSERVSMWAKRNRHLARIKAYPGAEAFLFDYAEEKDFDILLLDIEMPGMSGVELAKAVRRESAAVQIVFITGFYEYFSDGFDVSALHYLIKPASEEKLYPVLDRAVSNLCYRQRSVLLSTGEADIKVPLADILYAEAENVYVVVRYVAVGRAQEGQGSGSRGAYTGETLAESCRVRMSLGRFMEQLDETFFRVHRSFVVGLKYVKRITRTEVTMTNGDVIPLSRGMYSRVHEALIRYL